MTVPSPIETLSTLRRLPLFNGLPDDQLALIAGGATRLHFDSGALIFSEGDLCNELLIVEEGELRLFKSALNGRQQLLSIERKGSALAEVAVLDGGRYPATAEANSDVILVRLPAGRFRTVCVNHPELAERILKVLAYRLRRMVALVEELSFSTVRSRLIAHLLRLAEEQGTPSAHTVQFQLTENNEALAARLGTVRELVSRNLGRLHAERLIEIKKRTVRIPDVLRLRAEIDGEA